MAIARIDGDRVAEERELALDAVPEHKRAVWKPVVGEFPQVDSRIATVASHPTYTIEADQVRRTWAVTPKPLAEVKAAFARKVDSDAEIARLRFITGGAGMALTYREKFEQAEAVNGLGEGAANAMTEAEREAQFPTLAASVGIEAMNLWECAQLVRQRYTGFAQLSLLIERQRLTAKKSISAASSGAEVVAAYEALQWPMP